VRPIKEESRRREITGTRLVVSALVAFATLARAGDSQPPPRPVPACTCCVERVEITNVRGARRFRHGWGHSFTVEIDLRDTKQDNCRLEWWEYVSYEGSDWYTNAVFPSPLVRENTWQDHRRVNPDSSTWRPWDRRPRTGRRTVRLIDRPTIPLGNVRLGPEGRRYANLRRRLLIVARVVNDCPRCGVRARSAWIFQSLSEKEGRAHAALVVYGTGLPKGGRSAAEPFLLHATGGRRPPLLRPAPAESPDAVPRPR
jgi:hypothetical protein